jgi:hypothetical protein
MAVLPQTDAAQQPLTRESFTASGMLASEAAELAMVVEAWREAESYLGQEASYKLEWTACDIVYNSPRAYSFWEGSYVLEPNLRFFDVATQCNSITSQVMQALFAEDPPLVITPGPNMSPETALAWTTVIGRLMKEAGPNGATAGADRMPGLKHGFKEEFKLLLEQWGLKGTGAAVVYVEEEEECIEKRESSEVKLPSTLDPAGTKARRLGPPKITRTYKQVKRLKFEFIDLGSEDCIVWDPRAKGGDIRLAKWVVQRTMVDFYDLQELALNPRYDIPGAKIPPQMVDENDDLLRRDETDRETVVAGSLIDLFFAQAETDNRQGVPQAAQLGQNMAGGIHMAKGESTPQSNPLRNKLELLQYLDQQNGRVICVLNKKVVIRSGEADFFYLSANYYNRPNAMLGLGVGQLGSNNQQLNQWVVNSALKLLALNLNAPHLAPDTIGQAPRVLRIGAGKVMTVTEQAFTAGGMKLLETAKVPPEVFAVLQESTRRGESQTGADSLLVQGSSAGPRAGMGRTAGGSNIMAAKSEGRLDGPMDNLIQQIFLPYIGAIVWFVFHHMSDEEIEKILGEELGRAFLDGDPETGAKPFDWDDFHSAKFDYDVLMSAKLASLRLLAQQLVLIFEYGMNPEMQQFLADVHGTTIDLQTIYKLLLQVSHCSPGLANQIIRPLTEKEMARNQQRQQQAAQMGPGGKLAQIQAQGQVDSSLQEQKTFGNLAERALDKLQLTNELSGAATAE